MFNEFPYTDFHELNLDWILSKIKEFDEKMSELISNEDELTDEFENLLKEYNELKNYVYSQFTKANIEDVIEKHISTMIFVEISDSGHIIYNIPESWEDITFKTSNYDVIIPDFDKFGHLILFY